MVKDIVVYPDKRLKLISKNVEEFNSELHTLLDDMYDTMVEKSGIGLAAIQIGVAKRVMVINIPQDEELPQLKEDTLEIINPVITHKDGEVVSSEGCLSVPGVYEEVPRASHVVLEYQNRHGEMCTLENSEFLAIALQHEIDHLDGKVFIEKLSFIKRKKFEKEWKRNSKKR